MVSEERKEVLEAYERLSKKYVLPPLEQFEEEFAFRVQFPILHSMMSIVQDKIWQVVGHIETAMNPQRPVDFIESGFYSEQEHAELYAFYKEAMAIWHESGLSRFQGEAERAAAVKFLLDFYDKRLKPFALGFMGEQIKRWKEEMQKKGGPHRPAYHE